MVKNKKTKKQLVLELDELSELVVENQANIKNLLLENQQLAERIETMNGTIKDLELKICNLSDSLVSNERIKSLEDRMTAIETKNNEYLEKLENTPNASQIMREWLAGE